MQSDINSYRTKFVHYVAFLSQLFLKRFTQKSGVLEVLLHPLKLSCRVFSAIANFVIEADSVIVEIVIFPCKSRILFSEGKQLSLRQS